MSFHVGLLGTEKIEIVCSNPVLYEWHHYSNGLFSGGFMVWPVELVLYG